MTGHNSIKYCDFIDFYFNNTLNITKTDIKNNYLKLLGELTCVDELDNNLFESNLNKINSMGKIVIGYVINNETNYFEIVGSGTVIIEPKIIRCGKSVAHIEDIVVKSNWRGKKISQFILNELKQFAESKNCYKVILDCDEQVSGVYKSNGFDKKGIQMSLYF
jgi:glucosamine-phosphate N-acetyltransferase